MAKLEFTREERVVNALLINSYSIEDLGLLHGKMGIVLYFYTLSRIKSQKIYADFAEDLLDNVIESLHDKLPIDFEKGITGISWAIEYLIQNGYVEADSDEVLEDIDMRVNSELIHNMDKDINSVVSIGYYYISRLHYRVNDEDNMKVLDLKYNIVLLIDELERLINKGETHSQLYHLLNELRKLKIFNHKVDKLLATLEIDNTDYIFPFISKLSKEQAEDQLNQKDVKSRHAGFELKDVAEEEKYGIKYGIAGIGLQNLLTKID